MDLIIVFLFESACLNGLFQIHICGEITLTSLHQELEEDEKIKS